MLSALQSELAEQGTVRFYVRARPNAAQTKLMEQMDDGSIKIALKAVPEGGKANAELILFLAKEFGVLKQNVEIVSGKTDRRKLVAISL